MCFHQLQVAELTEIHQIIATCDAATICQIYSDSIEAFYKHFKNVYMGVKVKF